MTTHSHAHPEPEMQGAGSGLRLALFVTLLIFVVQLAGALLSNSLALLGDSGHVLSDFASLAISYFAVMLALRPAVSRKTFGWHRAEVFAALLNAILLLAMASVILYEAYLRMLSPPAVNAPLMLLFALAGLLGNAFVVMKLGGHSNLNVRSAFFHALSDMLSSVGVIVGAALIAVTGITAIDSMVSILIAGLMIAGSYRIGKDALRILFEFSPKGISAEKVCGILGSVPEVRGVHDVHTWSVCSDLVYLTAHIVVDDRGVKKTERIADKLAEKVNKELGISHTTFQFETKGHRHGKEAVCEISH